MGDRCCALALLLVWACACAPCNAVSSMTRALLQIAEPPGSNPISAPSAYINTTAPAPDGPSLNTSGRPNRVNGAVSPSGGPLASLGPLPAYSGRSLIITLDLWGPGLLTFNLQQQEILLSVMNETIVDVEADELQLLKVEDILPLSGPSAVSIYSGRNDSDFAAGPSGSRRLLRARSGRVLLQVPPNFILASGNSTNIAMMPHLEATVRASVEAGNADKLKRETENAVAGPMLPLLNEEGIDVRYMTLTSISVLSGTGEAGPPSSNAELSSGDIAAIVVASVLTPIAALLGWYIFRRQRLKRQTSIGKVVSESDRSSVEGGGQTSQMDRSPASLDGMQHFIAARLPYSQSLTPPGSLASSGASQGPGKGTLSKALDPNLCTVPFQELQISRTIGEGSFGRVFLGKWQETTVAIKILLAPGGGPLPDDSWDATDLSQLRQSSWSSKQENQTTAQRMIVAELSKEASLMAKLRHPNIVMFLGASLDPPCMITEFCARGSLLDVLHRASTNETVRKELDWKRRLRLALDAAKGMHYLHSRQPPILHRDLKSANLLVDKHWQAKVADFNLSRVVHPSSAISSLAASNPRWLPPEVLAGQSYSTSTDVYAYGLILWEILTWEIPWREETPWQVVIAVVDHDQRPEVPSEAEAAGGYPAAWNEYLHLMQSCWSKEVSKRPNFESIINKMRTLIDAEDATSGLGVPVNMVDEVLPGGQFADDAPRSIQPQGLASPFVNMPALPVQLSLRS